tara:strand:- start:701 stop:1372 length:672 start_codon:yes stop_codon:yes gene_type:complete
MLALKQALSLVSTTKLGWSPADESSLEAWYKNAVGITLNGSDVSQWADSSSNGYDMDQATAAEQPAYSGGVLTFVSSAKDNLQTTGQVSLTGNFTVGIKLTPAIAAPGTIIADNTTANEFIKYTAAANLRMKIDGSTINIPLDSGTFGDDYIILTRVSDVITLWKNGTAQSTTPTLAGTSDIDTIGARYDDNDYFDGTIEEIQIYSRSSSTLTSNVNDRLSTL